MPPSSTSPSPKPAEDPVSGAERSGVNRALSLTAAVAAAGLLGWTILTVSTGELSVAHVAMIVATSGLMFGMGQLVLRMLGGLPPWLPPHSTRFAVGFALWTLVVTVAAPVVPLAAIFWALALAGAAGLGLVALEHRNGGSHPDAAAMLDLLAIAAALRVATFNNEWLVQTSKSVRFIRHVDLMQHLAMVKQVMLHGAPMRELPFLAGVPSPPYHPGFTSLVATMLSALPVPQDDAFFQFLAPAVFAGFLVSVGVAAAAVARRRIAAPIGVAIMLGLYGLLALSPQAYGWGVRGVLYFLTNPPAALAVAFCAASLALLAAAGEERQTERLCLAALFAAATLIAKANTALAFAPAFAIVVIVGVIRRWWPLRSAVLAGITGVVTFAACAWVVGSGDSPIAVQWGAYGRYLIDSFRVSATASPLVALAPVLGGMGFVGDALMVVAYVAIQLLGALLVLLAIWLVPRRTDRASREALVTIAAFTGVALLIGLTLVQPGTGRYEAWNISAHTVVNLAWLGAALAAAGIALLAPKDPGPRTDTWLVVVGIAVVAALGIGSLAANPTDNWSPYRRAARGYYLLLERLASRTSPSDVVAHDSYNDSIMWVSGIGGRRSVLERANDVAASMPKEVVRRKRLIADLVAANTEGEARRAAEALGATLVITQVDRVGPGLEAAAREVDRQGDWVLLRVAPASAAVELDDGR